MLVIGTFEYSIELEQVLEELEHSGVPRKKLLIAAAIGFAAGFGLYLVFNKTSNRNFPKKLPEVVVIVQCQDIQIKQVTEILWKYKVLTVGDVTEPG
ncbi:MAG: hypothetical protein Q8920_01175 [Bacillota bacterium]|nr:hypothetical protein [Bacillota bacterium]